MEAFISHESLHYRKDILFDKDFNEELVKLVAGFDKLVPLPIVSDIEIRHITNDDYRGYFRSISTIAYCLNTHIDQLVITYEHEWCVGGGWTFCCIRDSRGIQEYIANFPNKDIDKCIEGIKNAYEYHCGLLAQSTIKSAKSA